MKARPPFIRSARDVPEKAHVYPQSTEKMGPTRRLGKEAGLERIGIHIQRLPPGTRSSWPHAEENEEEFVYVIDGEVDAWIDGHLHRMNPARRADMKPSDWWDDVPKRELGPHDGLPDALRRG
jgi:uncharacterized cupin superfamily protein